MFPPSTLPLTFVVLLSLWMSGCNAFRSHDRCDAADDGSCPAGQVCDREFELCVVPEEAVSCSVATAYQDCAIGQRCDVETQVCVEDAYTLVVVADKASSPTVLQIHTLVEFVARYAVGVVNRAQVLRRPVAVQRHDVDLSSEEATAADFAALFRPEVLGVITLTGTVAGIAQQYLSPAEILMVGQFTSSVEFERYARPWERYAYGLIPTPRSNFAMLSKFLSTWRPADDLTGGDPAVLACERMGFVYRDFPSTVYDNSLFRSQIGRYGSVRLEADISVEGDIELELESIYAKLSEADVDCVFLGSLNFDAALNENAILIGAHRAWREQNPEAKRIRWLTGNAAPQHRDALVAEGLEGEIVGALSTIFEVGGERSEGAVEALIQLHDEEAAAACPDVTADECSWLSPDEISSSWFQRIAPSDDQAMLLLVAAMHAERAFGAEFGREEFRDSFLSIVDDGTVRSACRRDTLDVCARRLDEGREIHYFGLSSDLTFDEHGRAETYDEVMVLRRFAADGALEEVARFTSPEMLEAYQNADPKEP